MELEQHRIVYESILKGTDLTIQKLAMKDKLLNRQRISIMGGVGGVGNGRDVGRYGQRREPVTQTQSQNRPQATPMQVQQGDEGGIGVYRYAAPPTVDYSSQVCGRPADGRAGRPVPANVRNTALVFPAKHESAPPPPMEAIQGGGGRAGGRPAQKGAQQPAHPRPPRMLDPLTHTPSLPCEGNNVGNKGGGDGGGPPVLFVRPANRNGRDNRMGGGVGGVVEEGVGYDSQGDSDTGGGGGVGVGVGGGGESSCDDGGSDTSGQGGQGGGRGRLGRVGVGRPSPRKAVVLVAGHQHSNNNANNNNGAVAAVGALARLRVKAAAGHNAPVVPTAPPPAVLGASPSGGMGGQGGQQLGIVAVAVSGIGKPLRNKPKPVSRQGRARQPHNRHNVMSDPGQTPAVVGYGGGR